MTSEADILYLGYLRPTIFFGEVSNLFLLGDLFNLLYKLISKAVSIVLKGWNTSFFFTLLYIVSYFAGMSAYLVVFVYQFGIQMVDIWYTNGRHLVYKIEKIAYFPRIIYSF